LSCSARSLSSQDEFGQPIVGDHEGSGLGRGQVIQAQARHLAPAERAVAASLPCPAITLPSRSTRIGPLNPNASMLATICRTCLCCDGAGFPHSASADRAPVSN
jgi:hypothetical protein